ncbi:MAG: hypothetical protein ACI9DG_002846 [Oleispira sp.]|jgi:hypothetical protein
MKSLISKLCLLVSLVLPSIAMTKDSDFVVGADINERKSTFKGIYSKTGYIPDFIMEINGSIVAFSGSHLQGFDLEGNRSSMFPPGIKRGVGLKRWPTEYKDKAISEINKHPFTHGKRGAELYDEYSSHTGTGSDANMGCLGEKPLRYGDVDEDGSKEIVLYLSEFDQKSDWVIFSPKKEKIFFSMRWQAKDFYKGGELAYYQYPSLENQNSSQNRGFQVFAKAFLGDFNKDKIPDILVWRKRFESLATGASKKGFELKGEHFEHYSLVDGEYQPQVTIPLQIKDWLADAELTWSKGYPSKSECAGQEGQLIPEMHDPLLNDPDVLK